MIVVKNRFSFVPIGFSSSELVGDSHNNCCSIDPKECVDIGSGRCAVNESVEDIDKNDDFEGEDKHCEYMNSLVSKCSVNLDIIKIKRKKNRRIKEFWAIFYTLFPPPSPPPLIIMPLSLSISDLQNTINLYPSCCF